MMSMKLLVLCIGIVATNLQSVQCFDQESIGKLKNLFEPVIAECGSKFGVTKEQMHEAHDKQEFSSIDNCFMACLFKKEGLINDKGLYDKDAADAAIKKILSGDDAANLLKVAETCSPVNDASVDDGDKGCDRAKLLFECIHENKATIQM